MIKQITLTKEERNKVALEFAEKIGFFGLNKDIFVLTKGFYMVKEHATNELEMMQMMTSYLPVIAEQVKSHEEFLKNQAEKNKKMTIMQIAIADSSELTVGEFLAKFIERYEPAGFMDIKISSILSDEADKALTLSMVKNPELISTTFQEEKMNELRVIYEDEFGVDEEEEEEKYDKECECDCHERMKHINETMDKLLSEIFETKK
jgi:hypothetical protein